MNWKHAASTALALAVTAGLVSAPRTASAQLIAEDSYKIGTVRANGEYAAATSIGSTAQDGLVNLGFATGRYTGGTGTSQFTSTTGGLVYAPLGINSTDSGKVSYAPAPLDGLTRASARSLSPTPPASATYWVSALVNRGAVSTTLGRDYVLAGFGGAPSTATTVPSGLSVGSTTGGPGLFFGYTGDTGNLAVRYRDTNNIIAETSLIAGSSVVANNTYALLFKIEIGAGVADTVSYWVNPVNFGTEDVLATDAAASGTITNTNILSSNADLLRLNYYSRNWNSSAFFDEMRLGTTLQSVTPGAAVVTVPESGTVVLLGLGGVALLGVVRRRRAS